MKANEFIKKYSVEEARDYHDVVGDSDFDHDLKRLVDSHDIVEKYKLFDVPRWNFIADYCKKNRISPFDNHNYDSAGRIYDDAVKDVESCQ